MGFVVYDPIDLLLVHAGFCVPHANTDRITINLRIQVFEPASSYSKGKYCLESEGCYYRGDRSPHIYGLFHDVLGARIF